MSTQKTVTFTVRTTECGCTVTRELNGRTETKRFRKSGYAGAIHTADKWIHERIDTYREAREVDGIQMPEVIIVGHKLSVRPPKRSQLTNMIRRLVDMLDQKCDTTNPDNELGRLCDEAEELICATTKT